MKNKQMTSSVIAVAVASILSACNTSNEEGLDKISGVDIAQIPLVCQTPNTIKVNSLGEALLDENGAQSCERVQLTCSGQIYDPITHSCAAKGRHENAPDETADANTEGKDQFATIFFAREDLTADSVDSGIILHAWNNESCNAYDPDYIVPGDSNDLEADDYWDTDWATGVKPDGFDENYGLFWTFKLLDDHTECANFIVHLENESFPDGNMRAYIARNPESTRYNEDRMSYVLGGITAVGNASIYPYYSEAGDPSDGLREIITDRAVHWFNADTLLINDDIAQSIRVYSADAMPTLFPGEGFRGLDYIEFSRANDALAQPELDRALYRSGMSQFVANEPNDPTAIKAMLKGRLMAVLVDDSGEAYTGYLMQTAGVLDHLYTQGDADADEASLGIIYDGNSVSASVWAPTASDVKLKLYAERDSDGEYAATTTNDMAYDEQTGIWSYQGDRSALDRQLFRYEISVYHPASDSFETHEVIDPYAVSVTTNGRYARFVDLNDADLKPEDWDDHSIPAGQDPEDIVIYEGHIRDFSASDASTPAEYRGKYLAFTEQDSAPVNHLKSLQQSGLTHFQVLPANDIASINEDEMKAINLSSTIGELCAEISDLTICSEANESDTIEAALNLFDANNETLKQTLNVLNGLDSFNWGYDPYAFNAPEGSYATDAESVARIVEMRSMVKALHDIGLRTSLDVVYNHTSTSGTSDNSVLDKVVPGYYHRLNVDTGDVLDESCCQDTAGEHRMFGKLVTDTLLSWSEHFKFDAFRFDLMNLIPRDVIVDSYNAVAVIDTDTYFYGEGWDFGAVANIGASVNNMAGTSLATFSDRQREAVRSGALFNSDGSRQDIDTIRVGLVANLADYVLQGQAGEFGTLSTFPVPGTAQDPADTVNYVDKHDNETLWDQLQYSLSSDLTSTERARIHAVAGSFPILSQGIPFIQMGSDLLRSKSMTRDSYDAGDFINKVDFTKNEHNWNVAFPNLYSCNGDNCEEQISNLLSDDSRKATSTDIELASEIYQGLLQVRASSKLFRLTTTAQVIDRVGFHNTGAEQTHGVIVMSLDDGAGCINSTKDFNGNCEATTDLRPDLDPNYDGIIVVFNGTDSEQTMTVPSAVGFELHSVHVNSEDAVTASSAVTEAEGNGNFTVPALTTAVFAKSQDGVQGTGINAYATTGAPDVAPYGTNPIYLRGVNTWDPVDAFEYIGEAVYELTLELDAGAYTFKIAEENWGYPNLGGGIDIVLGEATTIGGNGDDISFSLTDAGKYKFILNALSPNAPELTIAPAIEKPAYGDTTVYIRGTVNADGGWNTNNPMTFVSNSTYVTSIELTAGSYLFKLASEDWSTVNYGSGTTNTVSLDNALTLDGSGDINLTITEDGTYSFSIDTTEPTVPVVTVSKDVQPYTGMPIFLRGFDGDWGETNVFSYLGNGYYTITMPYTADTNFKIASGDWSTVNFGGATLTLGDALSLDSGGSDIGLNGFDETDMQFIFQVNDDSSQDATITVIDLSEY